MSKIKINEIESLASNADLQVTPTGTGVFEVAGDGDDGTLQLNSASNSNGVKIKSPNDAAGQSYTMTLPASNLTADQYLQIGTVTGSGATAAGQLQQATITPQDGTQLSASNVISGTLPPDRVGDLPATAGFGLKLISKATVTQDDTVQAIQFTNFDDGGLYRIITKNLLIKLISTKDYNTYYSSGTQHTVNGYFLDANGLPQNGIEWIESSSTSSSPTPYGWSSSSYVRIAQTQSTNINVGGSYIYNPIHSAFSEIELYSKAEYGYMRCVGWASQNRTLSVSSFSSSYNTRRIHGLQINASTAGDFYYGAGSEILCYKYVES